MSKEFSTPDVFGQAYKGAEMEKKGAVVQIVSLDTIPPHFLERMPGFEGKAEGYVLKRYRSRTERLPGGESFTAWEELADESDVAFFEEEASLGTAFPLSTHDSAALTQIDVVTILKRRQAELMSYLGDALPGAVLKSEFFLAPDASGQFNIYELQEKIPSHLDVAKLNQQDMSSLSAEQKTNARAQLEALLPKIEALIKKDNLPAFYQQFLPDLNYGNVAVTTQGDLKLYDTNICHRREDISARRVLLFTHGIIKELIQKLSI